MKRPNCLKFGDNPGKSARIVLKLYATMIISRIIRKIAFVMTLAAAAGCAGPIKTDYRIAKERAQTYVLRHPTLPPRTREAILRSSIQIGMTRDQVIAAWGRPIRIVRFRKGRQEEWTFGCEYPHFCTVQDGDRRRPFGHIRHESVAVLEDGKVVYFRR